MEESDFDQMENESLDRMFPRVKCPECLQTCSQDELDMFGGLCEECTNGTVAQ